MTYIKISVVIPTYNRAKSISVCLQSIIEQSHPPDEIIIIDDYSQDNTFKIVNEFCNKYPFIRYFKQDSNLGAQAARNLGIIESRGNWIAFQDSDDEWLPDKLEKQVRIIENNSNNPYLVIYSDCYRYDMTTKIKNIWVLPDFEGDNVRTELLKKPGPMFQSIVTSKTALQKIGLLDVNVPSYQEWDSAIKLSEICKFIHIKEPLFIYNIYDNNSISSDKLRDIDGYQYVIDKNSEYILELCGSSVLNKLILRNAMRAINFGLFDKARIILVNNNFKSIYGAVLKLIISKNKMGIIETLIFKIINRLI